MSCPEDGACLVGSEWSWISPRSQEDRTISCPNVRTHHCPDLWVPDLFGDFAGVCPSCGHHFPMEYRWYLENVFDYKVSKEFNQQLESVNPLGYEKFDLKLDKAKERTGLKSACITFETSIEDVAATVAVLCAPFRGGSVGAAEGEKFIRAAERAGRKRQPFIAYVHGTAGIRIQEGVNGVIQMPRCTIAVRRYIDMGRPVSCTLRHQLLRRARGLLPWLFLPISSRYNHRISVLPVQVSLPRPRECLCRPIIIEPITLCSGGHIHGIWDRREVKKNLHQSLLTMGGRNLYYR